MKTKTWILIFAALLLVCGALSIFTLLPGEAAAFAEISSQGKVVKTVDLRIEQEFSVELPNGGYNVVTVKDGKIAVTQASCPDHYCMERGYCNSGTQIVCLPNRLVIRFLGEQPIDAVVG